MTVSQRRIYGLVALVVLIAAVAAGSFLTKSYRQSFRVARALNDHDPIAARALLIPTLKARPNDSTTLLLAAKAARVLGEYGEAERLLAEAEAAGGPNEAIGFEGQLLGLCQGDFAGEELNVKQLADRNDPRAPEALLALAKGFFVAFRHAETTQICERLIATTPNPVAAYVLRGDVADISRKHEDAEKDYRAAVAAGPRNAVARAALARFLTKTGHTREALAQYDLASKLGDMEPATRLGRAKALIDDGQPVRADAELDDLLDSDQKHVEALIEKARLALQRQKPEEARPFLERALAAAPWHRDAAGLAAIVYKELKLPAEADAMAKRVAAMRVEDGQYGALKLKARDNSRDVPVRLALWKWCNEHGRPVEGVTWLTEVLRIDEKNAAARAGFAAYYDSTGQPKRAAALRNGATP